MADEVCSLMGFTRTLKFSNGLDEGSEKRYAHLRDDLTKAKVRGTDSVGNHYLYSVTCGNYNVEAEVEIE